MQRLDYFDLLSVELRCTFAGLALFRDRLPGDISRLVIALVFKASEGSSFGLYAHVSGEVPAVVPRGVD